MTDTPEPEITEEAEAVEEPKPSRGSRRGPLSLRIDEDTLERLKIHAEKLNVGYQTLLKSLLLRGLHDLDNADVVTFPSGMRKKRKDSLPVAKREEPTPEAPPEVVAPRPAAVSTGMSEEALDDLFQNMV